MSAVIYYSGTNEYGGQSFGPINEKGEIVARTKRDHPYSYDGFVLWRTLPNSEITATVYSDRLEQWDRAKTIALWDRHCKGKRYDTVSPTELQEFLRFWMEKKTLRVGLLMEYCNVSNGYPCWRIDYTTTVTNEGEPK